jgi:hypothetical protein
VLSTNQLRWYAARLRCMSPGEIARRAQDEARHRTWERRRSSGGPDLLDPHLSLERTFRATLPDGTRCAVPAAARAALLASADALMDGRWQVLGTERDDLVAPDWFLDPSSGRRAPSDVYAFRIQYRSEAVTGNVKQVWELSRHQHLTLLAAAYFISGEQRYAERVAEHLSSWWATNPFLTGIHWTSGIEVGLRLIAWTWIRRLLDEWSPVAALFEHNVHAVRQLYWHQRYLSLFRSRGSSANNHAVAEAAGRLVAADAFPWFVESPAWRAEAARDFRHELARNTFPSGVNRELASEYHGFVAELAYTAAVEADAAGAPLDRDTWTCICGMTDAAAALVDSTGRPPRQGDGDDGAALRVDGASAGGGPWSHLLALGATAFGPCAWWPGAERTNFSTFLGALLQRKRCIPERPDTRPDAFLDAGIVVLRTEPDAPEIWCRCDSGPHGFLRTAAHAHADALSVEVRHGGVDVLCDPGTYCYHGETAWRNYFRSTAAHNTVELAQSDQSRSGGPFLWLRHASSELIAFEADSAKEPRMWSALHTGYRGLSPAAVHRRTVRLYEEWRVLRIVDVIETSGSHALALRFHLGPAVDADLDGATARLHWIAPATGIAHHAVLALPHELQWRAHRGETDPLLGWYSSAFGAKEPTTTLVGTGMSRAPSLELSTTLKFR